MTVRYAAQRISTSHLDMIDLQDYGGTLLCNWSISILSLIQSIWDSHHSLHSIYVFRSTVPLFVIFFTLSTICSKGESVGEKARARAGAREKERARVTLHVVGNHQRR